MKINDYQATICRRLLIVILLLIGIIKGFDYQMMFPMIIVMKKEN